MNSKRSTRRRIKHAKSFIPEPLEETPPPNPQTEAQDRLIQISEGDQEEFVLSFRPLYELSRKSQTPKQRPQQPASYNPSPTRNLATENSESHTARSNLENTVVSILKGQSVFVRRVGESGTSSRVVLPPVKDKLLRNRQRASRTLENDRAPRRAVVIVNESDFLKPMKQVHKQATGKLVTPLRTREFTLSNPSRMLKLNFDFFKNTQLKLAS